MEGPSQNAEVVRDQPYFADGNIVLSALSSQHKNIRLFRVHTFMLSHHSPVFAGMLSLPPQPSVNETYEGVPVVRLTDDAEDLRDFLKALYDPGSLPLHDLRGDLAEDLAGTLRLATKYQADAMRSTIVKRLEGEWPRRLIDWLTFMAKYKQIHETYKMCLEDDHGWESLPDPVTAINVGLEFGIPSILPAAFYLLSLVNVHNGWETGLGGEASLWEYSFARWSRLKGPDCIRLLRGKSSLFSKMCGVWQDLDGKDLRLCEAAEGCQRTIIRKHGSFALHDRFNTASHRLRPDVFSALLSMIHEVDDMNICQKCNYNYKCALQAHMTTIWDELPNCFALPQTSDEI